jgi:hypothetical protein
MFTVRKFPCISILDMVLLVCIIKHHKSTEKGVLIVSRKNRILVSILILMGAAMLSSCTSAADTGSANATASVAPVCAEYEMV